MSSDEVHGEADAIQPLSSHPYSLKVRDAKVEEAENEKQTNNESGKVGVPSIPSVSSARFVTPPLTKRKQELLRWLLDRYAESVNFCIQKCLEHGLTSIASLHRVAYEEWRSRFDIAAHWFNSAGHMAVQTLRSWRRLCRQGEADPEKPPVYKARTMRLDLWELGGLCRFRGNAIQIRIRRSEHLWLPLIATEHHKRTYLHDWREGRSKVGEPTISLLRDKASVSVPFKRWVKAKPVEGVCGIDINERSVDLCILKPNEKPRFLKLDVSKLPAIRHASQLKRRSIQKKLDAPPQRPLQKRRLRAKYWHRESNRTNQILHIVSKRIAEILAREGAELVFEDLTNIRHSMRSKRKSENGRALRKDIRRRLNQWPFRKLQLYVEYKAMRLGYPTHHVEARDTSSTCSVCGVKNRVNERVFSCGVCGFKADRHLVGAWNIAVRWWTKNVGSNVPPEWRQMQPPVEVAVPLMKPEAEAQKSRHNPLRDLRTASSQLRSLLFFHRFLDSQQVPACLPGLLVRSLRI